MDDDSIKMVEENVDLLAEMSDNCPEDMFSMLRALELIDDIRSKSPSGNFNERIVIHEFTERQKNYERLLVEADSASDHRIPLLKQEAANLRRDLMMLEAIIT